MSSPTYAFAFAFAALAAASSACTARPRAPSDCAHESPAFHVDRLREVRQAFAVTEVLKSEMIPFPVQAVHDVCGRVAELVRPFCFEGAAALYGAMISEALNAGKDVPIANVEQQLELADNRWTRIHCRGLGNGL